MAAAPGTKPPNAGKGRKAGVPNKITADLKAMIDGALRAAGGQEYLEKQAVENPVAFMSLLGKTLPKDMKIDLLGKLRVSLDGRGPSGS